MTRQDDRIDPTTLSIRSQVAIFELKKALANEGWIHGVQITFDQVKCLDYPPTVDVKVIRDK